MRKCSSILIDSKLCKTMISQDFRHRCWLLQFMAFEIRIIFYNKMMMVIAQEKISNKIRYMQNTCNWRFIQFFFHTSFGCYIRPEQNISIFLFHLNRTEIFIRTTSCVSCVAYWFQLLLFICFSCHTHHILIFLVLTAR